MVSLLLGLKPLLPKFLVAKGSKAVRVGDLRAARRLSIEGLDSGMVLEAACPDPDEPIRIPYEIHGKLYHLSNDEIQEHLDKEEKMKKAAEEAKLLAMSKPEIIKVVHEEALKAGNDPKILESAKVSHEFNKIKDAKMKVLNREHSQKIKKAMVLKKKRLDQYIWTATSRLKPEPITNVKIYPNTKPTKKKNKIVSELMTSLGKRYEILKKIPEELRIQLDLPAPAPKQDSSQLLGRKRKIMELEP
ncbi:hypothetical protein Tco_0367432 [Tanacetum coccineum]